MSVSTFSKAVASGEAVPVTVTDTDGVFTVDCSAGTDFFLDFSSDHFSVADPITAPTFVGSVFNGYVGDTGTSTLTLSTLTGGSSSSPAEGDLAVLAIAIMRNDVITVTSAGWTLVTQIFEADTYNSKIAVFYKFMGETPDTSVVFSGSGTTSEGQAAAAYFFRGVGSNIFDATAIANNVGNTVIPDPLAITTNTANSLILVFGAGAHAQNNAEYTSGGGLDNFDSITGNDTDDITLGGGTHLMTTAGTYDPAAWSFSNIDSSGYSNVTVTMALIGKPPIIESSILASNVPSSLKNISIKGFGRENFDAPVELGWGSGIIFSNMPGAVLSIPSNLSEDFFAYEGNLYQDINRQVLAKIQKTEYITATQNWTAPTDVTEVDLLICGGGGAGSGNTTDSGTGGGSVIETTLTVSPGSEYSIIIGAGGAGTTDVLGPDGSPSSFDAYEIAGGGGGSSGDAGAGAGLGGYGSYLGSANPSPGYGIKGYGSGGYEGYNGRPNSGEGGGAASVGLNGGSGICIIKYWTAT